MEKRSRRSGVRKVGSAVRGWSAKVAGVAGRARADGEPDATLSPDERARRTEQRMTDEERFSLLYTMGGRAPGVPRLGVPALAIAGGAQGVAIPGGGRPAHGATALPAGLALGATFHPSLAREAGALVGREARRRGFNVLLGAGVTLPRDPRHGRGFEALSEDPWLAAVLAAEAVMGTQSQGVVSALKRLSLDVSAASEAWVDAIIDPAAHRESDLLAFQIAVERARPGALLAARHALNGAHCCGNDALLSGAVKGAFGFEGWILSDLDAVHGWDFALRGLDQQSAARLDERDAFREPLRAAHAEGRLPRERLSDMVRRILRSLYAVGADRWDEAPRVAADPARHHATALEIARQGTVLLKNDGLLPLAAGHRRIAVIGGHADLGVLAGGGSSQATPQGGHAAVVPLGGRGPLAALRNEVYLPSSPMAELRRLRPEAAIDYDPGAHPADAAELAGRSDVAIVFATKLESEGFDSPDLTLPFGQDGLIRAVASANPNTIVVLETGNPVAMPWRDEVKAILQGWYPGEAGGQAIAEIVTGEVDPSGRLPVTFPADLSQTPHPELYGFGAPPGAPHRVHYAEGAEVGHRWLARTGARPLFAFGHGLCYTTFSYGALDVRGGDTVTVSFIVTNTGSRPGADVPQLYLTEAAGERRTRLLGFERLELHPGHSRRVTLRADPRLLARFDEGTGCWHVAEGTHRLAIARSAAEPSLRAEAVLHGRDFGDPPAQASP